MSQSTFSIRMDEDLKRDFSEFCNSVGMSMTTAFVVFARKTLNERRIPFRNMIYIGDGLTDVPCMKLVKSNNGQSIAVFNKCEKITASRLMAEERVNFITEADYTVGSELDGIVKTIIEKISVVEKLERLHDQHKTSINEPERGCDDR